MIVRCACVASRCVFKCLSCEFKLLLQSSKHSARRSLLSSLHTSHLSRRHRTSPFSNMRAEAILLIAGAALAHPFLPRSQQNEEIPTTGPLIHSKPGPITPNFQPNPFPTVSRKRKFDEESALLSTNSKKRDIRTEVEVKTLQNDPPPCVCPHQFMPGYPMGIPIVPTMPGQGYCSDVDPKCSSGCVIL